MRLPARTQVPLASVAAAALTALVVLAQPAMATAPSAALGSHLGSTMHLVRGAFNTRSSGNWFGYVQGSAEKAGHPLFKSITGTWVVPTASQHTAGEAEHASTWLGIGGGCVNANCLVTDNTLIQTGTEEDVDSSGAASYFAWYEIIPSPAIRSPLVVNAGDKVHASIAQQLPGVWHIALRNVTTGASWSQTVPYTSTYLTAEWVDETPLTTGLFAPLPNLTPTHFDDATVNGQNAHLLTAERLYLIGGSGQIIGAPSVPQTDGNGFGDCAWATTCAVPSNF